MTTAALPLYHVTLGVGVPLAIHCILASDSSSKVTSGPDVSMNLGGPVKKSKETLYLSGRRTECTAVHKVESYMT